LFTDLSASNSVLAKASLGEPVAETLAAGFTPALGMVAAALESLMVTFCAAG
jgi:hypothetical protein